MNQQWLNFLHARGARPGPDGTPAIADFGDAPSEIRAALGAGARIELTPLATLQIHGPDAASFLQGQLTADVAAMAVGDSRLAAHLSAKGRIQFIVRLARLEDERFQLVLPDTLAEGARRRLGMFLLRSRARIEADAPGVALGVSGTDGLRILARIAGVLPQQPDTVTASGEAVYIAVPGAVPRVLVLLPEADAATLWAALDPLPPAAFDAWRLLDIGAGIPEVEPAATDEFLPQMLNLHLLGAVSFRKGCYVGQEIVARSEYLGRLKRRMYRARVHPGDGAPAPGEVLYAAGTGEAEQAGRIVSAAPHPDGGHEVLFCALIRCAEGAGLHRFAADGPALELQPLPYALPPLQAR